MREKRSIFLSLVPRPVRAIRVTKGGLEPSAIARIFPTSLTCDVTSEIAEDDWERGCIFLSPRRVWPFSRGVIFTRTRVLLGLKWGLLVVYRVCSSAENQIKSLLQFVSLSRRGHPNENDGDIRPLASLFQAFRLWG